ncbi:MAG: hypothetical protein AAGG56_14300 [Pseudomonadota bacterium]
MVELALALVDVILSAYTAEDMLEGEPILLSIGELDAVANVVRTIGTSIGISVRIVWILLPPRATPAD